MTEDKLNKANKINAEIKRLQDGMKAIILNIENFNASEAEKKKFVELAQEGFDRKITELEKEFIVL